VIHRRKFLGAVSALPLLAASRVPGENRQMECCEGLTFPLADGRQLGYATYGDPAGWPVLYFHGIPTSSIEARHFAPAALRAGCRLIAIDRPGFGLSTYQHCRRVVDWLADVHAFVHAVQLPGGLGLGQFSIACFSSGAAYALACAATMPGEQLRSVAVVDGIAPLELIAGHGGTAQMIFRLANRNPRLTSSVLELNTRQIHRRPDVVLRRTSRFFSPCDQGVFFRPASARILIDSFLHCVHCGPAGVVHDMSILSQPWGFDLASITRPVGLWYGSCDITTPPASMGSCLQNRLIHSSMSVYPGHGHLSMMEVAADEVFSYLLATAADPHPFR
jgi:pimeloyl-ACP methyl ester carboxylesterase